MLMSFKLVVFAAACLFSIDNLPGDVSAKTPTSNNFEPDNDESALNYGTISTTTSCYDCGIASTNYKSSTSSTTRPENEDSTELKVNNETCSKCYNRKPSIENITVSTFGSGIRISWRPLRETLEVCKYSYEINRTSPNSIIPYFRVEERNGHIFRNVRPCEKYNVNIKANNMCSMGFSYNTIVFSAPETIANVRISAVRGKTRVAWDRARSSECSRYLVQVGGNIFDTEDNSIDFDDELYCEDFTVQTVRSDNALGYATVASMPGPVRDVRIDNQEERVLTISWLPPEDDSCVKNYTVIVSKDKHEVFNNKTIETKEIIVKDLKPCTSYNISIAANSETQTGEFVTKNATTKESVPGTVREIKFDNKVERELRIIWLAPEDDSCVKNYTVIVSKDEEEVSNKTVEATEVTFEDLKPCTSYNVSVAANSQTHNGEYDETIGETNESVPGPVKNLKATTESESRLEITWEAPEEDSCVESYTVTLSTAEEQDIIVTVHETRTTIEKLKFCTTYDIAVVANSATQIGESAKISASTKSPVPGPVRNPTADNKNERELKITWEAPEDDSCVKSYTITWYTDDKEEKNDTVNTTEYIMKNLLSCTLYEVSITANTDSDSGPPKNTNGITRHSSPGKVVDLKIGNEEDKQFDVSWKPPEDANCIVNYSVILALDGKTIDKIYVNETNVTLYNLTACTEYVVKVAANTKEELGEAAEESNLTKPSVLNPPSIEEVEVRNTSVILNVTLESNEDNNCSILSVNYECLAFENPNHNWVRNVTGDFPLPIEEQTNDEFIIVIDKFSGYTNYTCRARVKNKAGYSEFSDEIEFQTEEELPSSPQNFQIDCNLNGSRNIGLTWDEPNRIPGVLKGYKVEYSSEPLHYIPKSCSEIFDNSSTDTDESFLLIENALPNYWYTAQVSAKTFDYGEPVIKNCTTRSGESEPIRNFNKSISAENIGCEGENVTLYLQWWHPCNTNGDLKMFTVEVTSGEEHYENTIEASYNDEMYEMWFYLNFYRDYMVKVYTQETQIGSMEITTPEGVPSAPEHIGSKGLNDTSLQISWSLPEMPNGELLGYDILIQALGSRTTVSKGCFEDKQNYTFSNITDTSLHFNKARPFYNYNYEIRANTNVGGGCTASGIIKTEESKSESVRNLNYFVVLKETVEYQAQAEVSFDRPCNVNTDKKIEYYVTLSGKSDSGTHEDTEWLRNASEQRATFHLKPKYVYTISVFVENQVGWSKGETTTVFEAPGGVPIPTKATVPIRQESGVEVSVVIEKDLFSEDYGVILYYAVIVGSRKFFNESDYSFGFWNGNDWPATGRWSAEGDLVKYQATPVKWNPFKTRADNEQFEFKLGQGDCAGDICNGVLRPETEYALQIRAFTDKAYRDTDAVYFTTKKLDDALSTMAIIGIVAGVLILFMIAGGVVLMYMRRRNPSYASEIETDKSSLLESLTKENFARYYAKLKEDPESLTNEFAELNNRSIFELTMSEAQLTENRKKNRFINILPYDEGRVKLRNDFSDYINASYISGYSNRIEYIATQGPLEGTCNDFWQMVVDENVTVIVMLAQFIEQRKEKCYKYFPDNHDEIQFGENVRVRCTAELDFGHYCERQISVQKDDVQHKLIHLQFMGWPDFGCPVGTENVLDICTAMRRHVEAASGLIIVHCSAGVGRTGTLITIDILLQALNYNCREIDVFNTVLELRKQRKNMVQTEAQYLYIYNCICDAILNPPSLLEIKGDPIYENVELKVIKRDDNENTEYK